MAETPYDIPDNMMEDVFDPKFWEKFAPEFTLGGDFDDYQLEFSDEEKDKLNEKLVREGYIQIVQPGLNSPIPEMAKLFDKLMENGLPPVFAFVFDEFWTLNSQLRSIMGKTLHEGYAMLPDFWGWRVMPGESGWTPHRDKGAESLFSDKTPKSLTVWIPLTQAHPLNGCMYIQPADRDPQYGVQGAQGFRGAIPNIRALPADPGDVFVWTQHVFHWGSHAADDHDLPPRMSIAFEYQRMDVPAWNTPLLDPVKMPSFEQRLALIAKQTMQYRHMYGFHDKLVELAQSIATRLNGSLDDIGIEGQSDAA